MTNSWIEPTKVKGSRGKVVLILLLSIAMFFGGFSFISTNPILGGLSIIIFGPLSVLLLVLFFRPQTMVLDADGFTISGGPLLKPSKTVWKDITEVFVYTQPQGGTLPGYNFRAGALKPTRLRRMAKAMGAEGIVGGRWELSTVELASLMENYRERATSNLGS